MEEKISRILFKHQLGFVLIPNFAGYLKRIG